MKKRFLLLFILLAIFSFYSYTFGDKAPTINCAGLPGCVDSSISKPSSPDTTNNLVAEYLSSIISLLIQFVAVFAVFALIFSGIIYMISAGNEEKVSKAKNYIIWSLVAVFLSISAWGIIRLLNGLTIG